jgi:hypothetical protein
MWSRVLVVLSFLSLSVQASPPAPEEPGTRVTVRLATASGQIPETESMVSALKAAGGEHQVQIRRRQMPDQQELTIDLWGATVPPADIPQTLREGFPELASAEIQVTALDPKDRPKLDKDCDVKEARGERCTVKKVVKIIKKE